MFVKGRLLGKTRLTEDGARGPYHLEQHNMVLDGEQQLFVLSKDSPR